VCRLENRSPSLAAQTSRKACDLRRRKESKRLRELRLRLATSSCLTPQPQRRRGPHLVNRREPHRRRFWYHLNSLILTKRFVAISPFALPATEHTWTGTSQNSTRAHKRNLCPLAALKLTIRYSLYSPRIPPIAVCGRPRPTRNKPGSHVRVGPGGASLLWILIWGSEKAIARRFCHPNGNRGGEISTQESNKVEWPWHHSRKWIAAPPKRYVQLLRRRWRPDECKGRRQWPS